MLNEQYVCVYFFIHPNCDSLNIHHFHLSRLGQVGVDMQYPPVAAAPRKRLKPLAILY